MRIRSIKPEFWRSRDIAALGIEERLLFIGLWSYVDDNGVGRDEEALIVSDLFAADMFEDPRETVARVSRGLSKLTEAGLIARYRVENRPYLEIKTWREHQRIDKPAKPRYPRSDDIRAILATSSRDPRETLAPGTGEQGNRGTEEQGSRTNTPCSSSEIQDPRPDVEHLCTLLADRIEQNSANGKRPTITRKWRDSARLMLDRDGYTREQIEWIIHWSQNDDFWSGNIRSMPKLREKFEQLVANAKRTRGPKIVGVASQAESLRFYEETA